MFEKIVDFAQKNQEVLIKGAITLAGVVAGVVVASLVKTDTGESVVERVVEGVVEIPAQQS